MMTTRDRIHARGVSHEGFTMIIALGVLFVTGLLLAAAFTVVNGDSHLSREDTTQKQAYYAALAGVQQYEYQLQANPDYWQTCEGPSATVLEQGRTAEEAKQRYEVEVMAATGQSKCTVSNPFTTVIESKGALANTFRIKSTGYVKTTGYSASAQRSIIATFQVLGFLDYIYFTNFETLDPILYGAGAECAGLYYSEWSKKGFRCETIQFITGDHINGPMHTNDAASVNGSPTFGRESQNPADAVEINGGTYSPFQEACNKETTATYYTATKCFTKGAILVPPPEDTTLAAYVEPKYLFAGATHIELKGEEMTVTYFRGPSQEEEVKETIKDPKNGLIYVKRGSLACGYTYAPEGSDTSQEVEKEKGCGTVYVSGNYSKSLTIAGEDELIINGNIYPTALEGKLGEKPLPAPPGTTVLGLIASKFVRVYHPCSGRSESGLKNPLIYAAILSTSHSFIVDNYGCGEPLGELHEYGAIAQNYRGIVGTGGAGGTGYLKDYKYDGRLATEEPPYFLAPLKAGWKISRETTP